MPLIENIGDGNDGTVYEESYNHQVIDYSMEEAKKVLNEKKEGLKNNINKCLENLERLTN